MTKRTTKRALILSAFSLLLCVSMLIGTTFAWFTDSVTSGNNKIVAGNLDIELYHTNAKGEEAKVDGVENLFTDKDGNPIKWEPGVIAYENFTVKNEGTLALKYALSMNVVDFNTTEDGKSLQDVLKVAVLENAKFSGDRATAQALKYDKTVADFSCEDDLLLPEDKRDFAIVIYWEPTANDNDYNLNNNKTAVGGTQNVTDYLYIDLGVTLTATQTPYESDSFNDQYDAGLSLDVAYVSNEFELKIALANKVMNIVLAKDIEVTETYTVNYTPSIDGAGFTISRADDFTGTIFTVKADATLTLANVTVDGGAKWSSDDASNRTNNGVKAAGNLIATEGNGNVVLNAGTVLQNNDGSHAVSLATRGGGSLTLNGAEIINNSSESGAIWGGGLITVNEGSKINNNSSTGFAGAIRMVGDCNFVMNGGEISYNYAADNGGVIWGYGASVYTLNGGKMEGNISGGAGGAIYTGDYSTVNIGGDFELCDNTAAEAGGMRLSNGTAFNMTGGKIHGNVSTNNRDYDGFYGWNPQVTMTGGEIADEVNITGGLSATFGGEAVVSGIIHFNLSTNHNTAYLAEDFGNCSIRFIVEGGHNADNFSAFNFKPADGYTYTEGDENKLICLNDGYHTVWGRYNNFWNCEVFALELD